MKITEFKILLATYGADIKRWEGADPVAAQELIASSEQVSILYNKEKTLDAALDGFSVPEVDPYLFERVMNRIDDGRAEEEPETVAPLHHIKPVKSVNTAHGARPFALWGGAVMALAAAVILFIYAAPAPVSVPASSASRNINIFLAELDSEIEEENDELEIMGLWKVADASLVAPDEEVETLLEELFDDSKKDADSQEKMDLWDLFLQGETLEL